ncbi:hypothetical protein [Gallionella capsiferriformans]|uniref:DUF1819 family protein n=1 Tax=Gallionella capsiferriformans (strain ES-2) TaxID=395494 RepID=D9SG92_GALCS|nr:hypothetical protein [Gallionella capsiferriformans]ADL55539.1 hypothetical protein Galf_1520 [Gallionella capsiferriformans ES-2]
MQQDKLSKAQTQLGFSAGGAISSRTVMQDEFSILLASESINASSDNYRHAILEHNVLEKSTASNRLKTFKYLRSLYALDPDVCLFREMRRLKQYAGTDKKLLMGLLSMARESILRECLTMVLAQPVGKSLGRPEFEEWIRAHVPGRYSESMYVSFSHNLYASFYQFGYLGESIGKARTRVRPVSGIASATYAAFLDWLEGRSGIALLQGTYSRALNISTDEHLALLQSAGRQGLLKVAYSGSVLDLAFPGFMKNSESRLAL